MMGLIPANVDELIYRLDGANVASPLRDSADRWRKLTDET